MGDTSFALVYGSKALVPVEKLEESIRVQHYNEKENEEQRNLDIDLLEERHLKALTQTQLYQARMAKAYNRRVSLRVFQVGDWVL